MSGGKQISQATVLVAGEDGPAAKKTRRLEQKAGEDGLAVKKIRRPERGLHHDVENLKERITIKYEIWEEAHEEQADQLLQIKAAIDAKSHEAAALQKKLNEIALSVECVVCLEVFGEHIASLNCTHIFDA